jgi:hypothetical protein
MLIAKCAEKRAGNLAAAGGILKIASEQLTAAKEISHVAHAKHVGGVCDAVGIGAHRRGGRSG